MAKRELPSPDVLRQLLDYDPETGKFTWLRRDRRWSSSDREHGRWNSTYAGKPALARINSKGYPEGKLFGRAVTAHRVAFAFVHGFWPAEIDHINGDRSDCRIANLRSVTKQENARNTGLGRRNTSGQVGVSWNIHWKNWQAYIYVSRQRIALGSFRQKGDAIAARKVAERKYGFHENHGRPRHRQA